MLPPQHERGRGEVFAGVSGLAEGIDHVHRVHLLPRLQLALLRHVVQLSQERLGDLRRVVPPQRHVEPLLLVPAEERLLVERDHRHQRRARLAVAPDLVDEGAAVRVDRLEPLRAHEAALLRLEELVALAQYLQLARGAPPAEPSGWAPLRRCPSSTACRRRAAPANIARLQPAVGGVGHLREVLLAVVALERVGAAKVELPEALLRALLWRAPALAGRVLLRAPPVSLPKQPRAGIARATGRGRAVGLLRFRGGRLLGGGDLGARREAWARGELGVAAQ